MTVVSFNSSPKKGSRIQDSPTSISTAYILLPVEQADHRQQKMNILLSPQITAGNNPFLLKTHTQSLYGRTHRKVFEETLFRTNYFHSSTFPDSSLLSDSKRLNELKKTGYTLPYTCTLSLTNSFLAPVWNLEFHFYCHFFYQVMTSY